jgi:uncharacterized protein (DUF1330 family)
MEVKNAVIPNKQQIKGFFEPGPEGPIYMVNLLKFKPLAEYEDGRETALTGREAYELYEAGVTRLLAQFGGFAAFGATTERLMLGEVEELWDKVAIAVYASRQAMLEMMQSQGMQEIAPHRAAGLAGQLNIETVGAYGSWLQAG